MEVQDIVKLIYQSVYGPGHMIRDEEGSLLLLREEYLFADPSATLPVSETIGNGLSRLNLSALKFGFPNLSLSTVNRLFVQTANAKTGKSWEMQQRLEAFRLYAAEGKTPFSPGEVDRYLIDYAKRGFPMLSHSEKYRHLYNPNYRVIDSRFVPFLSLFESIDKALKKKRFVNVAIDGYCGAGKSTLGGMLKEIYDANLISADDFFLPEELRTEERFGTPGSNIHYERFIEELAPMRENKPLSYRVFDCRVMDYTETIEVDPNPVTIVEGSYSLRPDFLSLYDIKVFLTVDRGEQLRRIEARSGKKALKDFKKRWIPMENEYFDAYDVESKADFVFDTTNKII